MVNACVSSAVPRRIGRARPLSPPRMLSLPWFARAILIVLGSATAGALEWVGAAGVFGARQEQVRYAPPTGTVHEVLMLTDEKGTRFTPDSLAIRPGDAVRFSFVSGGPHNVAFEPDRIPAGARAQLDANLGDERAGELVSYMYVSPGEGITVSFARLPSGAYHYNCSPHVVMGMKGVIIVR